jgi:DNA-binding protein Fis
MTESLTYKNEIQVQIDEIIKHKPHHIIIGTTSPDRIEIPIDDLSVVNLWDKCSNHKFKPSNGLYNIVLEQVEKPLIELALKAYNGNQVKTALMLGINRNTLKKKIDNYKLKPKKGAQALVVESVVAPTTTLTQ